MAITMTVAYTITPPSSCSTKGSIGFNITGGTGPFNVVLWQNFNGTAIILNNYTFVGYAPRTGTFTNLYSTYSVGALPYDYSYYIVVTDSLGNTNDPVADGGSKIVPYVDFLNASVTYSQPVCGDTIVPIDVYIPGGSGPYAGSLHTYNPLGYNIGPYIPGSAKSWNDADHVTINAPANTTQSYYVYVTGSTCDAYYLVNITGVAANPLSATSTDCTDLVNPNGTAHATIDPCVTGPYTLLWSTGDTTPYISGLPAGIYDVTLTTNNGTFKVSVNVNQTPSILPGQIPQWTYQDIQDKIANLECCAGKVGYDIAYKAFTGQKVCKCDHSGLKFVNRAIEILKGYIPPGTQMNSGVGAITSIYIEVPPLSNILGYVITYPLGASTYTVIRPGIFLTTNDMFNDIGGYLLSVGYLSFSINGNVLHLESDSYNHDGQTITITPTI